MNEPTPEAATEPARDASPSVPFAVLTAAIELWEQIKEHKVLQWGLAYQGAALARGYDMVVRTYGRPESAQRVVIGLLVVGARLLVLVVRQETVTVKPRMLIIVTKSVAACH